MKKIFSVLAGLIAALPVMAQEVPNYPGMPQVPTDMGMYQAFIGFFMAYGAMLLIVGVVYYVFMALAIMKLAKKFKIDNPWMAWIPLLNVWLLIQIAGLQWWWILLVVFAGFVPSIGTLISMAAGFYIWFKISEKAGKPQWFALLMFIPIVNIWAVFELAK
jgi:hypothetical protein